MGFGGVLGGAVVFSAGFRADLLPQDVRKVKARDEAATSQLERAKRKLQQSSALAAPRQVFTAVSGPKRPK